jgi:hypothetical protein
LGGEALAEVIDIFALVFAGTDAVMVSLKPYPQFWRFDKSIFFND